VWPGVWITRSRISPNRTSPPSASSTAGTHGGISNGRPERLRMLEPLASSGWTAIGRRCGLDRGVVAEVVPVTVGGHDQLQRPVAGGELLGDPRDRRDRGVDRDRLAGPLIGQDVDVRRDRPDDPRDPLHDQLSPVAIRECRQSMSGRFTFQH
jgi:hypothetical protein